MIEPTPPKPNDYDTTMEWNDNFDQWGWSTENREVENGAEKALKASMATVADAMDKVRQDVESQVARISISAARLVLQDMQRTAEITIAYVTDEEKHFDLVASFFDAELLFMRQFLGMIKNWLEEDEVWDDRDAEVVLADLEEAARLIREKLKERDAKAASG